MELDPKLAALALAAVAPTKFMVDAMATSLAFDGRWKLALGYLSAFLFIVMYQGYTGEIETAYSLKRLLAGDFLAAFSTMTGAVGLTQMQKLVETRKIERRKKPEKEEKE